MKQHAVIIVGGGAAGLRAAIAAHDAGVDVAVVSKLYVLRSHTVCAEGGINAPLGNHPDGGADTADVHAWDTVKGSDYLGDQDAIEILCRDAAKRVYELENWGVPFSRFSNGTIAQRHFGAESFPRACYVADKVGHAILYALVGQVIKRNIPLYEEQQVLSLVRDGDQVAGLIFMDLATGVIDFIAAQSVILATGGLGMVYRRSTNSLNVTGSGIGMAYDIGVPLKDMEFIQFHPTTLGDTGILITEGVRGEGGKLRNSLGEEFMVKYAPEKRDLAARDVVSRAILTEIREGRGVEGKYVNLDITHLGEKEIMLKLPSTREICLSLMKLDPVHEPIPVVPGHHYTMGGIDTDTSAATQLRGLYACGECACVSVHGANRLGGNGLLETVVFGAIAGESAARFAKQSGGNKTHASLEAATIEWSKRIDSLLKREKGENHYTLHKELGDVMTHEVGVYRTAEGLDRAEKAVSALQQRYQTAAVGHSGRIFNDSLRDYLELGHMLSVARCIIATARGREESRGAHSRIDFPKRDDTRFLKHSLCTRSDTGPKLTTKQVTMTKWKPETRTY